MRSNKAAKIGSIVVNLANITAVDGEPLQTWARMSWEFPNPADALAFVTGQAARFTAKKVTIMRVTGLTNALRFDRGRFVRHVVSVGDTLTVDQLAALAG